MEPIGAIPSRMLCLESIHPRVTPDAVTRLSRNKVLARGRPA
jgi:hypothetical protein